jgi:hypothetical protein
VLSLLFVSSVSFAGSINVNMSNSAAQFEGGISSEGGGEYQSGVIYNDQGGVMVDAGLMKGGGGEDTSGLVIVGGVKVVGARLVQVGVVNSASCVAIGGQGTFTPKDSHSVAFVGEFLSSLKITTYGDADRFSQFAVRLEMGPPHAKIFIGYREITFSLKAAASASIDKGGYMGMLVSF